MGWWNNANAVEVISNFMLFTSDAEYLSVLEEVLANQPASEIEGAAYNDDVLWWSLAWARAFELTRNDSYLQQAELCFDHVLPYWDNTCGGGLWWSNARSYKNAITNELFLAAATTLYKLTPSKAAFYANWTNLEWAWFQQSGMLNDQFLINDGLTANCTNNQGITWTYNQGVILGGLLNLYELSGDVKLIELAANISNAAITNLTYPSGILREPCEPNCGGDGPQFKGIFMRYLGYLLFSGALPPADQSNFCDFVFLNSNSIWSSDQSPSNNTFGLVWEGPYSFDGDAAGTCQVSALDCLISRLHCLPPQP
eukprot:m.491367 g.491367  ORF g.491367 m.491367 type:complete len:312 (+) comp57259_c1_seq5:2-937(+)